MKAEQRQQGSAEILLWSADSCLPCLQLDTHTDNAHTQPHTEKRHNSLP